MSYFIASSGVDAFPTSVWHYNITQKSLLFDLKDLRLMKVKVSESKDSIPVGGRSIPASRFDFSGEWGLDHSRSKSENTPHAAAAFSFFEKHLPELGVVVVNQ